ncbi:3-hydroxyacyl-thioester dehydratase HtdZ [Pigmentiphaga soli]|uniref:3-hydroxyacyl-thioester dehydratase HtdZ n=1 Tax=Pigmentiphaga soli TaxID=1007095 RepID=A0ABP8GP51_9BURK
MRRDFTLRELAACAGREVAVGDWHLVTQEQIDLFARATGDFQWIHTDPVRARATPAGSTIAHGYLTLSMLSRFRTDAIRVTDAAHSVNYGLNRVRFTAPVPVDHRIRARFTLASAAFAEKQAAWQFEWLCVVEIDGSARPACVAEAISLYYPATPSP